MDGVLRVVCPAEDADGSAEPDGCTRPVLVFEPGVTAATVKAALESLDCAAIVQAPADLDAFQALVDGDRLFYLSRGVLAERDLEALIASANAPRRPDAGLDQFLSARDLRRLALAQSISELADALRAAAANAVPADRTRCVLFDRERNVLWVPNESDGESTAAGVVSFVLRTGLSACVPRIGDDPRCDLELDDPGGEPSDRFLGVAVFCGTAVAVLVALRGNHAPPFEPRDVAALEAVAAHASPYLAAWLGGEDESPFRRRALRELEQPAFSGPEPLRLDAQWQRRASWLTLAAFVALLLALVFVRVPEYASGNAVVRNDGAVVATLPARHVRLDRPLHFANQTVRIASIEPRGADAIVTTTKLPRAQAGARGRAEVRAGSERLLFVLLPALKEPRHE
ncbi:MAG TPA: hypothetical protein VHK90_04420 [Thermoanaerobaculia bacterium]|nr:hypothetical protein [Thermoanaerobaculia bacterium]